MIGLLPDDPLSRGDAGQELLGAVPNTLTHAQGEVHDRLLSMGRRLVIAALGHTATLGGAELALARLAEATNPAEFDLRLLLFTRGPLVERLRAAHQAVTVLELGPLAEATRHDVGRSPLTAARTALGLIPFAGRLARHLRRIGPDLVYANTLKAGLIGVPVARTLRLPVVWHIHDRVSADYLPSLLVRLVRFVAKNGATAVIVNSEATAATLPGVPTVVAFPGYSPEQVGPRPTDRTPPSPAVVGIVGRISPTKGQLEFVRSARRVIEEVPDAKFRVIGSAMFNQEGYASAVQAEVHRLGLSLDPPTL